MGSRRVVSQRVALPCVIRCKFSLLIEGQFGISQFNQF